MKKFTLFLAALFMSVFAFAQGPAQELPNDPSVRKGKLDNGLTYYIRHNGKPAGRADFYLATNVGAIQETPDQDGLAHFLEHMCFNGTKNFPDKGILDWLQSIGASFGGNVNASTGVEQTIYMLNNIPLIRPTVVDTCILIMHDYSAFVENSPEEIDKERGVIIEERRSRRDASWRMYEQELPYLYGDSKYGSCTLIGSQENLQNFKPESLTNFYHTWYHPDMQALIVIGDIDVDETEAKIKKIFSDIPYTKTKPKDVIKIPGNKEPVVGIITDPECTSTSTQVLWKSDPIPEEMRSTIVGKVYSTVESIISSVMNERLQEIASKPDAPFVGAGVGIYDMTETMEALLGQVNSKDDAPIPAFKALMTEFYRMKRYGFTEAEIQRAKDNLLASYETASKNADTRSNSDFVSPLIYNFFDNESYMDPATEYELMKQVLPAITSDMINQAAEAYVTDSNFVVVHEAPEKEGLSHPTAQDFLDALAEVKAADIEAPAEEVSNAEFLDASKLKGSKIKKTYSGPYGSTVIELKNGVTVYMMPFDKEKDNISFTVLKDGGTSIVPEEDLPAFEDNILTIYDSNSGVSTFTQTEVQKMLTGKMLSVGAFCEKLRHGVRGSSTKKDIETALQLAYLYYTSYRFDQDAWNVSMNTINSVLPNLAKQPSYVLQKEIRKTLYPGHEGRHLFLDENVVAKANLGQLERNYKRLFADAAGMRAIFVGDFSVDTLAPLVAKYLGSIPKGKKALNWADNNDLIVPGARTNDFATDMQTPQTTVVDVYSAPVEYSVKAEVALDAASYIMDMRYTTSLREEEGGTYGAQTYSSMDDLPRNQAEFEVIYNCKPSMTEKLREIAEKELRDLAADGPTAEEFDMTVKNFQKRIPERRVKVSYWLECLRAYVTRNGRIFDKEYEEAVNSLTPQDIQNTLTELLDSGNHVSVIQRPQNSTEAE